ncbi:hypothetical protein [Hymenobacter glacieicola]|uniref:DUF2029 domain-containing protein n=1 Tax=Hymenobacter glacieicola TaxID=1562124 RepID=A0ABQ1WRG8_9BACT|nr:hypothetical protein [Hymenobacter glacieicola]GGG42858.1 hypothetical protein GCM10011378_19050 [Hymenobacter glacieicola]
MKPAVRILLLAGSAALYGVLAYATPRTEFGQLLGILLLAFGLYGWAMRAGLPLRQGLVAALVLRLLWLPALPALSDDYHRFRWDGLLVAQGVNPYQFRPDELLKPTGPLPAQLAAELYPRLNSPHYYSVYPPVCQAAFGAAARLFPTSALGFVVVLRLLILGAELGTALLLLALLRRFNLPAQQALWYLLNPLVLVELTGNLHFEALVVCLLLLLLWLATRGQVARAGAALALAVATKLLPLLVLPLLVRRLDWGQLLRFLSVLAIGLLVLFAPFLSIELFRNIGRSLTLYFRNFEFNASVYYLLRAAGQWYKGYNDIARIGPALACATAVGSLLLAARERQPAWATLPRALLLLLTLYFLLATTVHPWYITPLIALGVFTRLHYPVAWSGLAVLSYSAYRTSAYTENLWVVGLEYGLLLAVLVADARQGRFSAQPQRA